MQERKIGGVSRVVAIMGVLAFVLSACGGDDATEPVAETGGDATEPATEGAPENETQETETQNADKESVTLTMGGSQSSSSVFAFIAAQSRLAGDADGAMTINVRETGASVENIQLVQDGGIDFGLTGLPTVIEAYEGINAYEGEANPDLCNLMNYLVNAQPIAVRTDITSVEDLDGKSFAPGFQGSTSFDTYMNMFDVFGIDIDPFEGSLEDIVNAMKDGRIVGFVKTANGFTPDATFLDVASSVDIHTIGFTRDQIDEFVAADPINETLYTWGEVEAGSFLDNPDDYWTPTVIASYFTDSSMEEDIQYRLTKSFWEVQEQAAEETNYVGALDRTLEETTSTSDVFPICPGAERYYAEEGAL